MDEHDRLALSFVEIGDLDLTMRELRHVPAYSRSARLCAKALAAASKQSRCGTGGRRSRCGVFTAAVAAAGHLEHA
jgi:hypothetical protein